MKPNLKAAVIAALSCICFSCLYAQPASDSLNYPRVGQPCPDFVLRNIKYYSKTQATLNDFKGKWLMLVFWNKYCGACIASFPAESKMYELFKDKVQVMSVAIQDKEGQIEPMFAKYREKENLHQPCAFDSLLANRWNIYAGPHTLLIDDHGIVRANTTFINKRIMEGFLSGNPPKIPFDPQLAYDFERDPRTPFDDSKAFLVHNNGGVDSVFSYRSLISPFDCINQVRKSDPFIDETAKIKSERSGLRNGRFQVTGVPLISLYSYGWIGAMYPSRMNWVTPKLYYENIILDVKDSTLFESSDCSNLFCYSLSLPRAKATKEKVMAFMQQDLERYFGFTASVDERKFTMLKLVATEKAKRQLKTNGSASKISETSYKVDWFAVNTPWEKVYKQLKYMYGDDFADSTGITGNVDISLHCTYTKSDVKKALQNNGLDLVPYEVTKKVLVIRDAKD